MISTLLFLALAQGHSRSLNSKLLAASRNDFWFVALGDNRPAGAGLPPTRTFKEILSEVSTIDPEFIISSGDLLYGNEETLAQYQQEIRWMKPLIETLPCPFYNAPGNHEINDRPEFLKAYTSAFGPTYGSFEFGKFQFLQVCTELPAPSPSIFGAELSWLRNKLTGKPTVSFQHHPVFARESNSDKAGATISNAHEIHELYSKGNVKLALEGHDHIYDAQVHDGVQYRIAGGAGAPLDGQPEVGGYFHYLLVHVQGDELTATPVPIGALEVVTLGDGVAAASDYADTDLPLRNLEISSSFKPASIDAGYTTKKKKVKDVEARIAEIRKVGSSFVTRIELDLPKHHATIVTLSR